MSIPLFPEITLKVANPLWINADKPGNDEAELAQLEQEHQVWLLKIANKDIDLTPIGSTAAERDDDDEDEDEDDTNDYEESETPDEEDDDIDMEASFPGGDQNPSTEY